MHTRPVFANGEFYHIFNRGVEKRIVFETKRDLERFLTTLIYYTNPENKPRFSFRHRLSATNVKSKKKQKPIELISYCFMPNHFHLLLKQTAKNGVSNFLSKVTNSYTKYFNAKNKRVGPLFQGTFKAARVSSDEQLLHVSRYIHLNPLVDFIVKDLARFPFSSYPEYASLAKQSFCKKDYILKHFKNPEEYLQFVLDQEDYARTIKNQQRLLLEKVV